MDWKVKPKFFRKVGVSSPNYSVLACIWLWKSNSINSAGQFGRSNDFHCLYTCPASVNTVCQSQRSTLVPVGHNASLNAVEQSYRFHTDNASVDAVETPLDGELWEIITKILITSQIWNTNKESLKNNIPYTNTITTSSRTWIPTHNSLNFASFQVVISPQSQIKILEHFAGTCPACLRLGILISEN